MPPWPGIMFPVSLIFTLLLSKDAKISPKNANTIVKKAMLVKMSKSLSANVEYNNAAIKEIVIPLNRPLNVFPLLILGISFFPLNNFPPK